MQVPKTATSASGYRCLVGEIPLILLLIRGFGFTFLASGSLFLGPVPLMVSPEAFKAFFVSLFHTPVVGIPGASSIDFLKLSPLLLVDLDAGE